MEPLASNVAALPRRDAAVPPVPPRVPPHNIEAEQALLGALLVNNAAYERVAEILRAEDFADQVNGRLYAAIGKLVERGQIADANTLRNLFDQDPDLAEVGGARYLAQLAAAVVTVVDAQGYAEVLRDLSLRRQLIGFGETVVNDAYRHDIDREAAQLLEEAEASLYRLAETGAVEADFQPFSKAMAQAIAQADLAARHDGRLTGAPSGFTDLDALLGGLHNSDLVILAGRPGMGKTALATNIAYHVAAQGLTDPSRSMPVAFFSLEMSAEQLATRILAEQTEIPGEKIRRGALSPDQFHGLIEASRRLESIPLFIDDTPAATVTAVRSRARRLKRRRGLGLLIVDYLQLMRPSAGSKQENRVQEVSDITRGLKAIAKELNVPVLALSQLSREVEKREDKRPQLADLRESGSIEQDADMVLFVYREEYYLKQQEPDPSDDSPKGRERREAWEKRMGFAHGMAEVLVAKNRHGPVDSVKLGFEGETTRFYNLAAADRLPYSHG